MLRHRNILLTLALAAAALGTVSTAAPAARAQTAPTRSRASASTWTTTRPRGSSGSPTGVPARPRKADLIWKIAREPRALWLGRFTRPNFRVKVRRLIDPARAEGSVPIFTVLRAEATGCCPELHGRRSRRGPRHARSGTTTWRARSATTAW